MFHTLGRASALFGALTVLSPAPTDAQPDSLGVHFANQHIWRGYQFGSGVSADVVLDVGLLGHPRSALDRFGVRGRAEGAIPLGVPFDRRGERKSGEHYALGVDAYGCPNSLGCSWSFHVGVDELFRTQPLAGPRRSTEIWSRVIGEKNFRSAGVLVAPSVTVRRDFHAFDGWMTEAGIGSVFGRGGRTTAVSALWRLSDYRAWGTPPGGFRSHSVDLRVTFRSVHLDSGQPFLFSWTLLLEVGASLAASHVGPDVKFVRLGFALVR